jgi:hypothetical protein
VVYIFKQNLSARFNPRNSIIGILLHVNIKLRISTQTTDRSDNSEKKFRLLSRLYPYRLLPVVRLPIRHHTVSTLSASTTLRHYVRRLCLATLGGSRSHTRANYRQRSGARHQLAPECGKSPSRPAISSTSATRQSQQALGGSTTTSPPIVVVILRQQLDYIFVYFDYGRADRAAPDKS